MQRRSVSRWSLFFLEQKLSHLRYLPGTINKFDKQISELEKCSFRAFFPDGNIFHVLVKQWLQGLKDDKEEQLQAQFIFKGDLVGSLKQIHCNLSSFYSPMIDGFTPCQTCRCHGVPLDDRHEDKNKMSCPLTCNNLESPDIFDNSVKVGEQTVLFMPSFWCCLKLQQVSSHVDFKVIERTNLGSLCEVAGRTRGSRVYLGLPSHLSTSSAAKDIEGSIRTSLLKIAARDYNPVLHERGFHQELNVLVKESLLFGSLPEKLKETSRDSISTTQQSSPKEIRSLKQDAGIVIMEEELQLESKFEENRNSEHVAKEWEQLLGYRSPKISSVEHTCSPL